MPFLNCRHEWLSFDFNYCIFGHQIYRSSVPLLQSHIRHRPIALNGHWYLTFSAKDFSQCFDRCKEGEPACQSLNYYSDTKSCDLNNGTRTAHASDMIKNPMAIYFESHNRGKWSMLSVIEEQLDLKIPFFILISSLQRLKATVAASSCQEIYFKENSAKDGFYWLNSTGTEPLFLTFCKMKNGGGKRIFWKWILKWKWLKPRHWHTLMGYSWVKSEEIQELQPEISNSL